MILEPFSLHMTTSGQTLEATWDSSSVLQIISQFAVQIGTKEHPHSLLKALLCVLILSFQQMLTQWSM